MIGQQPDGEGGVALLVEALVRQEARRAEHGEPPGARGAAGRQHEEAPVVAGLMAALALPYRVPPSRTVPAVVAAGRCSPATGCAPSSADSGSSCATSTGPGSTRTTSAPEVTSRSSPGPSSASGNGTRTVRPGPAAVPRSTATPRSRSSVASARAPSGPADRGSRVPPADWPAVRATSASSSASSPSAMTISRRRCLLVPARAARFAAQPWCLGRRRAHPDGGGRWGGHRGAAT